jgi:hypothetical protein
VLIIPSTLGNLHFLNLRLRFATLMTSSTYIKTLGTFEVNALEMVILLGTDSILKYLERLIYSTLENLLLLVGQASTDNTIVGPVPSLLYI